MFPPSQRNQTEHFRACLSSGSFSISYSSVTCWIVSPTRFTSTGTSDGILLGHRLCGGLHYLRWGRSWWRSAPSSTHDVLRRWGEGTQRECCWTRRQRLDWGTYRLRTNHGCQGNHQKPGQKQKILPQGFQKKPALLTPGFIILASRNSSQYVSVVLKPSSLQ